MFGRLFTAVSMLMLGLGANYAYAFKLPDISMPEIRLPELREINIPGQQLAKDKLNKGEIIEKLYTNHRLIFQGVVVEVFNNKGLIIGHVSNPADQTILENILVDIKALEGRYVDVYVSEPRESATLTIDKTIAATIETLFFGDSDVHVLNYSINVYNGRVYLLGIAGSEREHLRAVDVASRVQGVRQVIDLIDVQGQVKK